MMYGVKLPVRAAICALVVFLVSGSVSFAIASTAPSTPANYPLSSGVYPSYCYQSPQVYDPCAGGGCPAMGTDYAHHVSDTTKMSGSGGSKLAAGDTILIQAPELVNAANPNSGINNNTNCRSVINTSANTVFVPWNDAQQWSYFIAAVTNGKVPGVTLGSCCAPNAPNATALAPPTPQVCSCWASSTDNADIGRRYLGQRAANPNNINDHGSLYSTTSDPKYWGGQNDIYGPITTSIDIPPGTHLNGGVVTTTDYKTNYEATFICQNGAWKATHEIGSCEPFAGKCATGYSTSTGGGTLSGLPPTKTGYDALCSTTQSVEEDMTGVVESVSGNGSTASPWKWQCVGTLSTETCSAIEPENGVCGSADDRNGGPGYNVAPSAPSAQLCSVGTATAVSESSDRSKWLWSCGPVGGGASSASCYARNTAVPGECGSDGTPAAPYPTLTSYPVNLCISGDASNYFQTGNGWWSWICIPSTGSNTYYATCAAVNANPVAACGSANNSSFTDPPSTGLCASGDTASTPSFNGLYWTWTCQETNGASVNCKAGNPDAASCGTDNTQSLVGLTTSSPYLCSLNSSVSNFTTISGDKGWTWNCVNSTTPSGISCSATNSDAPVNGACGSANGGTYTTAPTTGLCSNSSSTVSMSGSGPWTWTCSGLYGGSTSPTCSANPPGPVNGVCGAANGKSYTSVPTTSLCQNGASPTPPPFDTSGGGTGPWTWNCPGTNGGSLSPTCTAYYLPLAINGTCGPTAGDALPDIPNVGLCSTGTPDPSPVTAINNTGVGTNNGWQWSCDGSGTGSTSQTCMAYQCDTCTGTTTLGFSSTRNGASESHPSCIMRGTAEGTITYNLSSDNTGMTNKTVSWSDDLGAFSLIIPYQVAPRAIFCPKCYMQPVSITPGAIGTAITHGTASCTGDEKTGGFITAPSPNLN